MRRRCGRVLDSWLTSWHAPRTHVRRPEANRRTRKGLRPTPWGFRYDSTPLGGWALLRFAPGWRFAQLQEHAAQALGVQERHARAVGAGARGLVHETEAGLAGAAERGVEVAHLEANVVQAGAPGLEETRHRVAGVLRLEKLEGDGAEAQEDDAQGSAVERLLAAALGAERRDEPLRQRVGLAGGDGDVREARHGRVRVPRRAAHDAAPGRCVPNTPRSVSHTSPSVARRFSASRMGGTRFSLPRAARSSRAIAWSTATASRCARHAASRFARSRSTAGSGRNGGAAAGSSSAKRFTPTMTRSPDSTWRCHSQAARWISSATQPLSMAASM